MNRPRWFDGLLAWLVRRDWRVPLVGAWAVFLLIPVWKTGWVYDDMFNSSLPGLLIYHHRTPLEDALVQITHWTVNTGRFNPLIHILKEASFLVYRNLFWYKTALVAGVLVNLFVFYRLLKRLGASADLAAFCCFFAVTLIQLRVFDDPVYAYNDLMQWLFLGTILSLTTFHRYLTSGRIGWLALSIFLYLLTTLTYEITYLFWILHAGLFLTTRGRWARAAALIPFAFVAVPLTLGAALVHAHMGKAHQSYGTDLNIVVVANTTLKQISAAWPGSYAALGPKTVVAGIFSEQTLTDHLLTLSLAFAAAALLLTRVVRRGVGEPTAWRGLLLLGLLLAVLPAPLIGVTRKYQEVLTYGVGYLPVYIEYFGVALLFTCGVGFLASRVRPGKATAVSLVGVVSLLCAGVAVVHCETNVRVVRFLRQPYLTPRREVEELLDHGRLLQSVPVGATLVVDAFRWDTSGGGDFFYCCHTKTRLNKVICSRMWDAKKLAKLVTKPGSEEAPNVLRVRYSDPVSENGWVVAGTVHHLQTTVNGDVSQSDISHIRLAVRRGLHSAPDRSFVFHAAYYSRKGAEPPHRVDIAVEEMQRTAVTRNWTVYNVKLPFPTVESETIWLEFKPPAAVAGRTSAALTTRSIRP